MNRFRGFTLIELMIVVAILGIMAAIAAPAIFGHSSPPKPKSETVCKAGYQFVVTEWIGSSPDEMVQLIDENGRGVPCPNTETTFN